MHLGFSSQGVLQSAGAALTSGNLSYLASFFFFLGIALKAYLGVMQIFLISLYKEFSYLALAVYLLSYYIPFTCLALIPLVQVVTGLLGSLLTLLCFFPITVSGFLLSFFLFGDARIALVQSSITNLFFLSILLTLA